MQWLLNKNKSTKISDKINFFGSFSVFAGMSERALFRLDDWYPY